MGKQTLTPEIATSIEAYWELSGPDTLTDAEICSRVGITAKQLEGWLRRGTKVTRSGGKTESLRVIRERARAKTKLTYLQRMVVMVAEAHAAAQRALNPIALPGQAAATPNYNGAANLFRVAFQGLQWLAERQFPLAFNLARMPNAGGAKKTAAEVAAEINEMVRGMAASVPQRDEHATADQL